MRWLLVLLGVAAVAVLLFWLQDDSEATRGHRDDVPAAVSPETPGESGEVEREEEGELVVLRGVVVNEDDEPIPGALLEVLRAEGVERESTTSGADGRLELEVAPANHWATQVRHPDYVATIVYFHLDLPGLERRIVLARGAKCGVRVVGPDREPIADAVVSATRVEEYGIAGMWNWDQTHDLTSGNTDVDGMFALGALPMGPVGIKVVRSGFAIHREQLEVVSEAPLEHLVVLNRGGAIEGQVFGPGGEPVEGARVFTEAREALSDAQGRYRIELVGAGPATVRAEKKDLGPAFFGERIGWDDPVPVQVVVGETIPGVDLHLGQASWVVGRVVDDKGAPVAGVYVSAPIRGAYILNDDFETDEDGRFVAGPYHVPAPGRLHLYLRKAGYLTNQPPTHEVTSGARVDVGEIKLSASPPIVGRVVDSNGDPVTGASITVRQGWVNAMSNAQGRFELAVPFAQKLTVWATGPPRSPGRSTPVVVDARSVDSREELVLTLVEPLTIRGRIVDGNGNPRPGVALIARSAESGNTTVHWARTEEDGTYEFESLAPGRYRVGIVGTGGVYYWDDARWIEDPAPVEVDAGAAGVDFTFSYTGGIVTARVVSKRTGRPLRKFRHGLIRYRMLLPQSVDTGENNDEEGKFRIEFPQDGSWAIEFQADGHASYRTPRLSLKKGEVKNLGTIRLGEGGTLVGIVKDAHGLPVPYTRINILSPKFETNKDEPFTGRDGRFRIPSISPGLYNVFAVSPRHPIAFVRNITLREGQTTEVEVKFERPGPLEIRVRDTGGSPIKDASLSFTFPAIAPLSSKQFRNKIPAGYGSHNSDAEGRIFQHSLPAGPVTLTIEAQGFTPVTRQLRLAPGENKRLEITLTPKK